MLITYRLEDNTIQDNRTLYITIQYNRISYNTIQYNTIQYNTIQYKTILLVYPTRYRGISPGESRQSSQSSHHI